MKTVQPETTTNKPAGLMIRLRLNTISTTPSTTKKVKKCAAKEKKKGTRKRKSRSRHESKLDSADKQDGDTSTDSSSISSPTAATGGSRSFHWTSERIETTKLIFRTVILAN